MSTCWILLLLCLAIIVGLIVIDPDLRNSPEYQSLRRSDDLDNSIEVWQSESELPQAMADFVKDYIHHSNKELVMSVLMDAQHYKNRTGKRPTHVYAESETAAQLLTQPKIMRLLGFEIMRIDPMPENAKDRKFFVV